MEEALIKRIMPNSLEAEQSVVGSMIMDKDAIVTAMEMLVCLFRQIGLFLRYNLRHGNAEHGRFLSCAVRDYL